MMIDARALTWHHLFPSDTTFTVRNGPEALQRSLETLNTGSRGSVLVSWGDRPQDLPNLAPYMGVVAVNGRGITPDTLRDAGFSHVRRFAVLPNMEDARWFVPLESRKVASEAIRIHSCFRPLAQAKHAAAVMAARTGATFLFRNQIIVAQRTMPPLEEALRTALPGIDIRLALSSGTPGPARKPTISVLDVNGNWHAFVKLARTGLSRELVEKEANALRHLAEIPAVADRVPELLFGMDIDGTFAAAQRALPGVMSGPDLTPAHADLLRAFSIGPEKKVSDTEFMHSLSRRMHSTTLPDPRLVTAFELVSKVLGNAVVPQTIVHGDFAPWNLRSHDGQLRAFDWETAHIDGLPLLDEVQYHIQAGVLLRDWTDEQAFDHLLAFESIQEGPRFEPYVIRALQIAGLLESILRHEAEGRPQSARSNLLNRYLIDRLIDHMAREMA